VNDNRIGFLRKLYIMPGRGKVKRSFQVNTDISSVNCGHRLKRKRHIERSGIGMISIRLLLSIYSEQCPT
jgi:hypothetical protein